MTESPVAGSCKKAIKYCLSAINTTRGTSSTSAVGQSHYKGITFHQNLHTISALEMNRDIQVPT